MPFYTNMTDLAPNESEGKSGRGGGGDNTLARLELILEHNYVRRPCCKLSLAHPTKTRGRSRHPCHRSHPPLTKGARSPWGCNLFRSDPFSIWRGLLMPCIIIVHCNNTRSTLFYSLKGSRVEIMSIRSNGQ